MNIILASSSPSRKKLLESLGLSFEVRSHLVDEQKYKDQIQDPYLLCQTLAKAKVQSVHQDHSWIIGVDQVVFFKNQIFGKPKSRQRAFEYLSLLQGHTHELISGLYLQKPDARFYEKLTVSQLTMHNLTSEEINFYLDKEEPYECAGAYKLESLGVGLFKEIKSPDFNSIIGLPLISLCSQMKELLFQKNSV